MQVLGLLESTPKYPNAYFVHGIGTECSFWKKAAIIAKTRIPLDWLETIVHPTASISRMATLGKGVVLQQVTIANQACIGHHVIILPNSVISYDTVIGDYSCITGGECISGLVTMGHNCCLGTNRSIIDEVKIGHGCLIGMERWAAQRPAELGDGWDSGQVPAQDARVPTLSIPSRKKFDKDDRPLGQTNQGF